MGWAKVELTVRWGLSAANVGACIYFIWAMAYNLVPYFTAHPVLGLNATRIRLCEASLVLSIGYSILLNTRAFLKLRRSPDRNVDLGRRRAELGRNNGWESCLVQCFQTLYGATLLAASLTTAVFAGKWWRVLAGRGQSSLANQCFGLAIYSWVVAALGFLIPAALFFLVCTGRRAAT